MFDVIGEVDERKVADALNVVPHKRKISWVNWMAAAACFCLCVAGVLILWQGADRSRRHDPIDAPQYIANFSEPDLEEIYKEDLYSELLPQKIPETLAFISSYKTEYDPIANPDNEKYLSLFFGTEKTNTSLEIKVLKYDGKEAIADPQKTDTFDLTSYYEYLNVPDSVGAEAPNLISLFRAEDISPSIAKRRMYVFPDGLCKAEIEILCGDYVVAYHYAGTELSAGLFYDMITSSNYTGGK